jgi:hypothetical protein
MPNQDYKDFKQIEDEKKRGAELPVLSKEENEQRSKHIRKMRDAQQTRDGSRKEFDGMDYVTRYETNLQADMSYIPPKLNKGDVRVVTGTTREKNNSLLAALLNYNFEASITAYDKNDNEIDELGSHLADLVRKSRELEDYDSKRDMIYRELLTQGDVFGMDSLITKFRVKRNADFNWEKGVDIKKFEVSENLELEYKRPEFTMLSGTKVFLGNIREPLIQNQPFIVVVETEPYEVVKTQFQKWERWKFVPKKIARLQDTTDVSGYRDWTLLTTKDNYCEKIWYMDRPNNILQLYLSGVPMLPVGFPLEEVSPSGLYPIAQGSCEKVPFFAYAKGIAEKMKVDQAIIDEFFKLAILKQQQSYRPTLANNTGSELSPDIYMAGTVIDNIDSEKIKPIFPTNGMSQPDVMFLQYMKEIMDSKSVSPMMTGESTGQGRMTAAQYLDQKRQSLQKLGLIVWGIVKFEQHVNWLRLQSILKYGLGDGFSEDTLITVKTTLENGKKGQRVFEFNGDMTKSVSPEQVRIESELLTARYGIETRKVYLDWNGLKKANLTFRVNVVPTEKNTSELNQMLLTNKIRDAAELFGPQSMNLGYWEELWAMKNDVDFSRAFNQAPQMAGAGGVLNGQPQQPNTQGTPDFSNIGPKAVINNENPALRAK